MENQQQTLFKTRDLRKKDQFKIDDAYLNGYARVCKPVATAVYNSLCRHAEFNSQKAFPSQEKIAYEHKISVRTVRKGIKTLAEYHIILIEQERTKGRFANYIYTLLDKSEWKPLTIGTKRPMVNHRHQTVGRLTAYGVGPTKDYKEQRITNIKDNKELATQGVADLNNLIELFKPVNPSYERLFANKSQRSSLERLVKKFGRERTENTIKLLPQILGKPYAPVITTPYQLEQKLGNLLIFLKNSKPNLIEIKR